MSASFTSPTPVFTSYPRAFSLSASFAAGLFLVHRQLGMLMQIQVERIDLGMQRMAGVRWQVQNTVTGEYCTFTEDDLLGRFTQNEVSFDAGAVRPSPLDNRLAARLARDLSVYPVSRRPDRSGQQPRAVPQGNRAPTAHGNHTQNYEPEYGRYRRRSSASVLMAAMFLASEMPAICWLAPLMAMARYIRAALNNQYGSE